MQRTYKVICAISMAALTGGVLVATFHHRPARSDATAPVAMEKRTATHKSEPSVIYAPIIPADPTVPEHSMRHLTDR